jgi:hypothetical protein
MTSKKSLFAIAMGLTLLMAVVVVPQAGAAQRFVVRPFVSYGPVFAPAYYPYYYPRVYAARPRTGDVKVSTHVKDASIYVDGGFAGTTGKLKEFPLQPGNHDVEVRDAGGHSLFHDRVQVLVGKTVEIRL